ncbi:MAG: hypothetical protein GXY82_02675 [Methanospirillum sp.]|mgnify:CR=1 FL=1|nr:hypothetical protein [Methanospirillum sp.]
MDEIVLIERFFDEYASQFARALADTPEVDVEATAGAFADCFVEAGPRGVVCGRNDGAFREQIPHGFAFYRGIGIRSMTVATLAPSQLDAGHWGVRVGWSAAYDLGGRSGTVEFEVLYFVQLTGSGPKIFAYITGDEEAELRRLGLLGAPDQGGPSGG